MLPARLLRTQLEEVLTTRDCQTRRDAVAAGKGQVVLREPCDVFDVSLEMMLYRGQELKLLPERTLSRSSAGPRIRP